MELDILTMGVVTASVAFLYSVGLFLFGGLQKTYRGFTLLGSAAALLGAGHFLLVLSGSLGQIFTVLIANLCLIGSIVLYFEGARRLLGRRKRLHPLSIILSAAGAFLLYFHVFIVPSLNARVLGTSAIQAVMAGSCAWLLLNSRQKGIWRVPDISTAAVFALYALFQLGRLTVTLTENPMDSLMSAGSIHGYIFISAIFLVSGTAFGFTWMVGKRSELKLTELATTDPLTGILNRRGLEHLTSIEFSKMHRNGTGLAAVVLDIDNFKEVNDQFGHNTGDMVLTAVAGVISGNLRPFDIFARLGGDEFIFVISETDMASAMEITQRVRRQIAAADFMSSDQRIKVSGSFGLAFTMKPPRSLDHLIRAADRYMYHSKINGRNRVTGGRAGDR